MGSPAIFVGNNTHFLTQGVEIPSQSLASATALPRVAGVLYYITDDDMIYYDDGATLIAIGSGAQGAQGSQGAVGSQGAQGDAGTQGAQGAQGDAGATGAQGSQGDAGAQGPQGDTGAQGQQGIAGVGGGIQWEFDDVGNSPPPSSGTFKTDNGSMPFVTEIYISKTDYNTNNVANYLLSLDDSTNATKGYLSFFNSNDPTTGVIFKITSVTDQTGYVEIAVTYVQEFGASFAAGVKSVFFSPAGDVGATGAQGAQGTAGTAGAQGSQGNQGSVGAQGFQGGAYATFIANPDFAIDANGTTPPTGITTYINTTATEEYNGTSGGTVSGTLTQSVTTTSPIVGAQSWSFAKTGSASTKGAGAYAAFTIDDAYKSKPIQIQIQYDTTKGAGAYATGDIEIGIWDVTAGALIPLSNSDSTVKTMTKLPAGVGPFRATFNASTNTSYRLVVHSSSTTTQNYTVYLDQLVVTPNILVSGVAMSDWTSYTGTSSSWANTNSNYNSRFKRDGDSADFQHYITCTGAGSATFTMSYAQFFGNSGLTIDTTKLAGMFSGDGMICIGKYSLYDVATQNYNGNVFLNPNTALIYLGDADGVGVVTATTPFTIASSDTISIRVDALPIAQWAGSGNVVNGPNIEFASNNGTSPTVSDTTNFVNGPDGALIGSITGNLSRRARFQYPKQPTDRISIEVSSNRIDWFPIADSMLIAGVWCQRYSNENGIRYGMGRYTLVSSTEIDVDFGQYAANLGGSFGAAGTAWSAGAGTGYWRARKESGVAATALAEAVPGVSNGFLSFNGVKGRESASIAGYVGEVLAATRTSNFSQGTPTLGTWYDITSVSINLTVGNWLLIAESDMNIATNDAVLTRLSFAELAIRESSTVIYRGRGTPLAYGNSGVTQYGYGRACLVYPVNISTPVTYKLSIRAVNVSGSPTMLELETPASTENPTLFRAIRIS